MWRCAEGGSRRAEDDFFMLGREVGNGKEYEKIWRTEGFGFRGSFGSAGMDFKGDNLRKLEKDSFPHSQLSMLRVKFKEKQFEPGGSFLGWGFEVIGFRL